MVDSNAVKLTALVVAGVLAFLLVGAALRFAAWILTFAVLAVLVAAAGYVVYQLVSGWMAGANEGKAERTVQNREADADADPVDELRDRYVSGTLSEAEFERQLEEVVDPDGADRVEPDRRAERTAERE